MACPRAAETYESASRPGGWLDSLKGVPHNLQAALAAVILATSGLSLLLSPISALAVNVPLAWKTGRTGGATFVSAANACSAAWQANQASNPNLCPGDYCWTSGGPNFKGTQCTSICTGANCGAAISCSSSAADCGYGAELTAICPTGLEVDRRTGQCVDPASAKTNGASCPSSSKPVAFGTGNKWLVEHDIDLPGTSREGGLAFIRIYNSNAATVSSALGAAWSIEFGQRLGFDSVNAIVWAYRPDGRAERFVLSGGTYSGEADVSDRLYAEPSGFRLETSSVVEHYNASGRLTSRTDFRGRTRDFTYDGAARLTAVTDHAGRAITFTYDSLDRISTAIDPIGRAVVYEYDTANNLIRVTYPNQKTRNYHYNEPALTSGADLPHALTGITDENGTRYMSYAYDTAGRAISELSPSVANGADELHFSYENGTTVVQAPGGSVQTYSFQTVLGVPRLVGLNQPAGSGCGSSASSLSYDARGNVASMIDFGGMTTTFSYEVGRNLETQRVEGAGTPQARTRTTEWHAIWRRPARIAQPFRISRFIYNGDLVDGQAVACAPATATVSVGGTTRPIEVLCKRIDYATLDGTGAQAFEATMDSSATQRQWAFTYDSVGQTLTATDPEGRMEAYEYYSDTNFPGPQPYDPNADAVKLLLHGEGPPGSKVITDSSGNHRTVTVSGDAQLGTSAKFGGTSISFDGSGDLLSVPSSSDFDFAGDFCVEAWIRPAVVTGVRVIAMRQQSGNSAAFQFRLDDARLTGIVRSTLGSDVVGIGGGNVVAGVWQHAAFCRKNSSLALYLNGQRVAAGSSSANTTPSVARPFVIGAYDDGSGRSLYFLGSIDELRVTTGVARYDGNFLPERQAFLDPEFSIYSPEAVGHSAGDLKRAIDAAGKVQDFLGYDRTGRLRRSVDRKGISTSVAYGPRGFVEAVAVTPTTGLVRVTTYGRDSVGQVSSIALPDGTSLIFSYDAAHRLTGITDGRGNSITYTLDASGNRIGEDVKDASGALRRSVARSFDALNRLQQVGLRE